MKIFRLLLVDMKLGGILKKGYPALVLLCAFYAYFFHIFTDNLKNIYGIEGAGLGDLLAFVHCGTIPCIRMIQQRDFQISFMWLALIMYEMALPLSYPVSAMENWGYPFVMKTGRRQWWLSKCLYTMGINLISMLLETGTFFICCLIFRLDTDLRWHTRIAEIIFGGADGSGQILTQGQNIFLLIGAPTLGIMAMSMVLLVMSVSFGRTTAYVIGTAWLVASVFTIHPLLPGNCTMAIRSSLIDVEGMTPLTQIFSCAGIIVSAVCFGTVEIRRKDFCRLNHAGSILEHEEDN